MAHGNWPTHPSMVVLLASARWRLAFVSCLATATSGSEGFNPCFSGCLGSTADSIYSTAIKHVIKFHSAHFLSVLGSKAGRNRLIPATFRNFFSRQPTLPMQLISSTNGQPRKISLISPAIQPQTPDDRALLFSQTSIIEYRRSRQVHDFFKTDTIFPDSVNSAYSLETKWCIQPELGLAVVKS